MPYFIRSYSNMSSPSPALATRLEAARAVVHDAAQMAMAMRPPPGGPQASQKSAQDWLTETDGAVEAFIANRMKALFPDDGFQGEEGGVARTGSLRWVVDPIDGTSNYARGRCRWCISLGLLDGDEPVAGVIDAPALGEVYTALRGYGAFLNGKRIQASPVKDPTSSMIEMGWSNRVPKPVFMEKMDAIMAMGTMPRSGGCGALALADVASGRLDGYIEIVINLWDVAAALPLLAEAGARVSPFLQEGGLTGPATIMAANPHIAQALSEAVSIPLA
ncbi:inositol monophosphatase family protein [Acetobacter ascendens]|uniref:Inositol monophosphatase n=2 Tax=Acetobacter ascendens TaxID=481146 RepID=A0A1D8QUL2_9PROT|nr:inositol monophosphatase family protein [Acetobacter ascendens]AOW46045.1 inositol monophosphatase [Acetobacter ascendens]AOW49928.1 inositol monophosphatase [Acetobacter ascendens]RCL08487.1 inositol monophosphatase [Acetobacter pasteurianus]